MSASPPVDPGTRQTRATKATANSLAAGVLLIVLSASTHDGWLVLLAGFSFGLVIAAFVLRPRLDTLDVMVTSPARARVDEQVTLALTVTNLGERPSAAVTLTVMAPGIDPTQVRVPPLSGRESAVSALPVVPRQRGALSTLRLMVSTSAPLSVLTVMQTRAVPMSLLVHPALDGAIALAPAGVGDASTTPLAAPGVDVQGIREWHRGESVGRLYARGTARRGTPLVLDRHDDTGHGIAIIVAGGAGSAENPLWEAMISVIAGTLVDAAFAGRPVAALTNQRGLADAGGADAVGLLDWCARLVAPGPPTVDDFRRATAAIGRGGSIVLADLNWNAASPVPNAFESAAAGDAALFVLHRHDDRSDVLCLHPSAHSPPRAAGS